MTTGQGRLYQRLQSERSRLFVGRESEIRFFADALKAPVPPFFLLYIYGPAGTGKSALLASFVSVCHDADVQPVRLDARDIDPSPSGLMSALKDALGIDRSESAISYLSSIGRRTALLIDTFELLLPIEEWFREVFSPQLPDDTVVAVCSKNQPSVGWRSDPGWQSLMVVKTIGNLSVDESRQYLSTRGVPADQHRRILQFTGGHPLALSLIADLFVLQPDTHFIPEAAPDVIGALVQQFLQGVPTPEHRKALYAASMVLAVSEPLLQQMTEADDPHALFEWLRALSFVEADHAGIILHDLARNALTADLRWRNFAAYESLKAKARAYYADQLKRSHGDAHGQALRDYLYLHRDHQLVQPFISDEAATGGHLVPHRIVGERPQASEWDELVQVIERYEGKAAAKIATHWYMRQPESAVVFKDQRGVKRGLMMIITLSQATKSDLRVDPAADALMSYLSKTTPLKAGEAATFVRFWGSFDTYQDMSPTQAAMFTSVLQHCLTVPKLAYTFFYCADPLFWTPLIEEGLFNRLPEADFRIEDKAYGVFVHDWRQIDPATWLTIWVEGRRMADLSASARQSTPPNQMSRSAFRTHVRDVLRDFTAPDLLIKSPIVGLTFLNDHVDDPDNLYDKVTALQTVITKIIDGFANSPRREKLYRAVQYTYIEPQGTQEQVAEYLDLPYSTYRGHLSAGVDLVIDALWRMEYEGAAL